MKMSLTRLMIAALCVAVPFTALADPIKIKGSDTMTPLVTHWAQSFMEQNAQADIAVTGGGSGTGIAALINGTTDICAASREMKPEEQALAAKNGRQPYETMVAYDGITIIVNPANPLTAVTMEQLKDIFTGKLTDWSALGGPAAPILVISRESSSGTFAFFQEHVLAKQDYSPKARFVSSNAAIVQAASADKGVIGYVGMAFAEKAAGQVKSLMVRKDAAAPAVEASEANVKNKSYPIARPLYLYTNGAPAGAVKSFIDYILSSPGQQLALQEGYVPVK